jgi:digeranylgeranylglycerophospholipid reductase
MSHDSYDYDVIVAGAGVAGPLAAIAAAKKGAKTLILDRNDETQPGKKTNWGWVCGDAVAKSHLAFIRKEVGLSFSEPEIEREVNGVYALSPDLQNKFTFEGEGAVLNRPEFARRIVREAVKAGAEYRPNYEVEGPIVEGGSVVGVFGRDDKKREYRLRSRLVIDCLGMTSTIRRRLPPNDFVEKDIKIEDIESTGRYIMNFEPVKEDLAYYDPDNAIIHLNQELAPGGYGWVFPRKGNRVNIGIGVEKKCLDVRNAKLGKKDTLHTLIDGYVAWNTAIRPAGIDDTDHNGKGYWQVSVRRQFGSLVYNNYLGAGDSVAMPNPVSAGGIGSAMIAGILAGQVAAEAAEAKDTGIDRLWRYNRMYNEHYGGKTAALEVFRVYLQSLNNDLINYGMSHFVTKVEAEQLAYGLIPEMTVMNKFQKLVSGVANLSAFKNLLFTVGKMKKLNELYKKYPKDPRSFKAWNDVIQREMREVKEKFPPMPV